MIGRAYGVDYDEKTGTGGGLRSNWEAIIFLLMKPHVGEKCRQFSLSDIIREWEKKDKGLLLVLEFLGHKDKLRHRKQKSEGQCRK